MLYHTNIVEVPVKQVCVSLGTSRIFTSSEERKKYWEKYYFSRSSEDVNMQLVPHFYVLGEAGKYYVPGRAGKIVFFLLLRAGVLRGAGKYYFSHSSEDVKMRLVPRLSMCYVMAGNAVWKNIA